MSSRRLRDLLSTVGKVLVGAVTTGYVLADKPLLTTRLTKCAPCEHYEEHNQGCQKCGCRVTYKARLKEAKCPIGKW